MMLRLFHQQNIRLRLLLRVFCELACPFILNALYYWNKFK